MQVSRGSSQLGIIHSYRFTYIPRARRFLVLTFPIPWTYTFICKFGMGQPTMEMGGSSQLTVARALEIVRNNEEGQVHPSVTAVLEKAVAEIWRKIQAQPTSYAMSRDEFAVFNFYRNRFKDSQVAQQAVARFWNHFRGDTTHVNGSR